MVLGTGTKMNGKSIDYPPSGRMNVNLARVTCKEGEQSSFRNGFLLRANRERQVQFVARRLKDEWLLDVAAFVEEQSRALGDGHHVLALLLTSQYT